MNYPHYQRIAPPRRTRTPLTRAGIIILAFTLGALVSLWVFQRAIPAALLARQAAAAAAPDSAAHLAGPDSSASSSTGQPAAQPTTRQTNAGDHPAGVAAKRVPPVAQRALAGTPTAAGDNAARTHSHVNSESAPLATPIQTARRASNEQPSSTLKDSGGRSCLLAISKSKLTLHGKGSAAEITVSLGSLTGPAAVNATTGDWANVVVFPGARRAGVSTYRIVAVGQRPGTYGVTFNSPCGTKHITVTVE